MERKETSVECPSCSSRIQIDLRTGKVMGWHRPGRTDPQGKPLVTEADWNAAHQKVESRLTDGTDRFEAGLTREKSRDKDLDDLFDDLHRKKTRGSGGEDNLGGPGE